MKKLLLSGKKWKFRKAGDSDWMPAFVPGCVHTDLMINNVIQDPFFGQNAKEIQWIENENWEYALKFSVPRDFFTGGLCELEFDGLDTFATVELNGRCILISENMYLPFRLDITPLVKRRKNELRIHFKSSYQFPLKDYHKLGYILPANNDKGEKRVSPFVRKAPYMYGGDWAPRLLTSGIWKNVRLVGTETARITYCSAIPRLIDSEKAEIDLHCQVRIAKSGNFTLQFLCDGQIVAFTSLDVTEGLVTKQIRFTIQNPTLWWPRGYGEQKLYSIACELMLDGKSEDHYEFKTGLRTCILKQTTDNQGKSFVFNINGKDIYIRGANLIPAEYFPSKITYEKYEEILNNSISVNLNMLRAWGGGIYEDDRFYELCDQYGIMVWQDFMFSCSIYPSGKNFLDNIEKEIKHHVSRLINHPSLVIWCGNSEIQEGFFTWGWKDLPDFKPDEAWQSYTEIFHGLIPRILEELDGTRPYLPSSPYPGEAGGPDLSKGDYHYWDIVKNIQPYTAFKDNIGRFMSEFGFKGYPELRTLQSFLDPRDMNLRSEALEYHQGWETGSDLVEKNLALFYPPVKLFELQVYQSQLLQADAIEYAIEIHRKDKPNCMGSIYWQLNDCWPAASCAGIDYYGRWKAMHYRLKSAFRDVILMATTDNHSLNIFVVSDLNEDRTIQLQFRILNFKGDILAEENKMHELKSNGAQMVYKQKINEFLTENEKRSTLLLMNAFDGNHLLAHKLQYFVKPKDLLLEDPEISLHIEKKFNKYFIFITSAYLAKNVFLAHQTVDGFFSDNYFDLLPGEDKIVVFEPKDRCECKLSDFIYLSLWNCFSF